MTVSLAEAKPLLLLRAQVQAGPGMQKGKRMLGMPQGPQGRLA